MISLFNIIPRAGFFVKKRKHPGLYLAATILLVASLELLGLVQPVKDQVFSWLGPLLTANARIGSGVVNLANSFTRMRKAAYRIQDLERRLAHTQAELGQLAQVKAENEALRTMLEDVDRSLEESVITTPILSLAQPAVAVGAKRGLKTGLPVLVNNTLVGTLSQIETHYSFVSLLISKNSAPILAQTEQGVEGIVAGDGKHVLLTELPAEAEIKVGARVTTVGQPGIKPGLLVGEITSVSSSAAAATQQARLEQYVSFYESTVVEIYEPY